MGVLTIEGIIDNGQIKLASDVKLPERTKVFVIVPDMQIEQIVHHFSPRLKNSDQAAEFEMEIVQEPSDASL
ncbi:MAG TPA: antitoxin AF2212-like protein [Pyrinomonadaceae bacterium]|jgi:predicted DNA-binding antitoxin AbrB/MazE fold protein|nr:antitoxin AF2212-like protein [Pyrinomonadaceae bacterium]